MTRVLLRPWLATVKTDSKRIASDINLPSPPSSSRSSFDNDGMTRDSYVSSGGENSDHDIAENGVVGSGGSDGDADGDFDGSFSSLHNDGDVILEGQSEQSEQQQQADEREDDEQDEHAFEDDIKLVTENLVNKVAEVVNDSFSEIAQSENGDANDSEHGDQPDLATATDGGVDIEELWKDFQIDFEGETVLPSGLRLVHGVAEMPFCRELAEGEQHRFTNQLNFLKNILTKYICRYKTAMPFLNPVDSVRFKIPHYYLVIRQPMDLNTVKNRINFLWYRCADECISDLRLIFSNCYQFNAPTDYVYKSGKKLEEYLDEKLKDMPQVEVEIPCPPLPNMEEYHKLNAKRSSKSRTDSISEHSENGDCGSTNGLFGPIKMTTRSERGVMVRKPSKDLPAPISTPQPKPPSVRKVPLNDALRYCLDFVKELFSKKHAEYAWPFWEPVNPRDYPDYQQKIKRPVDLTSIKMNIETGKYATVNEFTNDMRLMFSNCLRYNSPESPIIEQARKLREVFEYKLARIPDEFWSQKLAVHHHNTSNGRQTSPSVRFATTTATSASTPSSSKHDSHKSKKVKTHAENGGSSGTKKSFKGRSSVENSGHPALNLARFSALSNTPSTSTAGEASRMEQLERQVATLTNALQACLVYGNTSGADQARNALMNAMMNSTPAAPTTHNGTTPSTGRGRPRKNGYQNQPKSGGSGNKKTTKKQTTSRKRKHHLSSDEDSDSDDELDNQVMAEPFDPESIEDLKKLKNDLENLRAKDLQNVLRILQSTEPSLRCDDDSNVEIDFEALKPKTLIALRKYVTSCMLNAKSSPASHSTAASQAATATTPAANNSSNKRLCHSSNSLRSASILDTDCDNSTINNWSRAGSRASDLQLSEESSSDSEVDD